MKVSEVMTSAVETIGPGDTAWYAASRMSELDVGLLPVAEEGRAIGVLTDRDIALRCCGEGRDPRSTEVSEIMTTEVIQCEETEELGQASKIMQDRKIRRLLITNEDGRIAGLLSVDDLATRMHDPSVYSRVLENVSLAAPDSRGEAS
ncbi:MAG TPA: CBS domain-containing protein [Candidatus Krumholzibacterium sp.]|nr:CBS domain-containing protein [Candidatus Krumholzibacterium sp.]